MRARVLSPSVFVLWLLHTDLAGCSLKFSRLSFGGFLFIYALILGMIGSKYVFINIKSPPYFILLFVKKTIRIRGKKLNALNFTSSAKGNVLVFLARKSPGYWEICRSDKSLS